MVRVTGPPNLALRYRSSKSSLVPLAKPCIFAPQICEVLRRLVYPRQSKRSLSAPFCFGAGDRTFEPWLASFAHPNQTLSQPPTSAYLLRKSARLCVGLFIHAKAKGAFRLLFALVRVTGPPNLALRDRSSKSNPVPLAKPCIFAPQICTVSVDALST